MHRLAAAAVLALSAGIVLSIAVFSGSSPFARASGGAQLAVTTRLFVSPSGSDSNRCARAAPCQSLDRAYHVAKPGQTVLVQAGSYPRQTVRSASEGQQPPSVGSAGPTLITIRPEAGASVQIADLFVAGASSVVFADLTVEGTITVENENPGAQGSTNVTLRSDSAKTVRIVGQVSDISIRGGSYGNTVDSQPQIKKYNPTDPDSAAPSNILIDGVSFHDFRRSNATVHTECLQILNGSTITVRKSLFWNCDGTGDIGITPNSPIVNLTMENNFIAGGGDTGYGIQIGTEQRNFVFRNNSSTQPIFFSDSISGYGPYTFTGNYIPHNAQLCRSSATYSHNVIRGGTCSATDVNVPVLSFVDAANHNLHLARGAGAVGRGDPANHPGGDIDGDVRPTRWTPDAGADQRETAAIVLGRSIGAVHLGEREADAIGFYGPPRRSRVAVGGHKLQRFAYRLHDGVIWMLSASGVIVAAGTTSPYYETSKGVGPGSPMAEVRAWRHLAWMPCVAAYRSSAGHGAAVQVKPAGGQRGSTVASLSIWMRGYLSCPR